MSEVLDSRQVDDSVERFASAAALRAAHTELLKRYRASADPHEMLAEVEGFIRKGSATGTSLDADNDRWAAQSLLDYWTAILYRVGHEPLDGTLAEFDPTQAPELDDADPPYIGLEAFREEDHSRFFGRQRLVEEWIGRLADSRLLAVVGSSGSGKSSLVRGGVLPALRAGGVPGSERWRYYPPVVPGSEPLTGLVRLFQPPDSAPEWVEQQVRELRRDPLQLARVVGAGGEEPVVLVVDQFEEVFTLCSDEEARQAFAASLVGLAQAPGPRHTVILTLRSDFEAQVVQLRALEPLFGQIQARVTPLNAVELREAIERPAERVGLKVEQGVVDQLIKEILGEPAGLPLLQFALLKLWENRERNRVTRETYQRLGGARRALACSADEVYEGLFEDQVTARCILLRMVRPGEGLEVTSSRVRRDRLHETCGASDRVDHVLDRLRQARLIRRTAGDAPGADQFEVAHEALIRNWPRLVGWLDEERIALRQRLRLTSSAEQWQAKGRDPGALLRGSLLKDARRYTDLGPLEREFVAASQAEDERVKRERAEARRREEEQERALLLVQERAHAERERAEKAELARQVAEAKQREEEQRRALLLEQERTRAEKAEYARRVQENATRRLRRLAAVLLFFLAVAVLSGALAVRFYLNVRDDTSIATSRELAASAQAQVPADPELSVLLAMEAVSTWDTPQAQAALRQALFASRVRAVMRGPEKMAGAAFSPGGRLVVTADADGAARVWDTGTGKLLHVLRGHAGRVTHVAFSPDGRQIVTAGDDGTAHIWDTRRWKTIFVLQGHHDVVNDAAYSPDGRLIVTASNDGTALVWDARTGKPLHSLRGHGDVVNTAEFSPDGRFIVTASHDGTVEVWDGHRGAALYALGDKRISGLRTGPSKAGVTGGAGLYSLAGGVSPVNDAVFSPDGRLIVTAGDDDTARIWRAGTGRLLQVLTGHTGPVLRAVFSPDSRLVATASADDTARLWDVGTGKVRHVLIQHLDRVIAVAFSPDGSLLATASDDSTAAVWDASTGSLITVLNGHEDPLTSVAFSPDGRLVVTSSNDGTARVWDPEAGRMFRPAPGRAGPTRATVTPNGKVLITAGPDYAARIWQAATGKLVHRLSRQLGPINAVASSPDGRLAITADDDYTASVWNVATGKRLYILGGHLGSVTSAAFSPDGKLVVTAGDDGTARLWDAATGKLLRILRRHAGAVTRARFSPDGSMVVTVSDDHTAILWRTSSGAILHILKGHRDPVLDAAFSPDGTLVVTAGADRLAALWNSQTGKVVFVLRGHSGPVRSAAFSPDGKLVVTAGDDHTARLWDVGTGTQLSILRGHSGPVTSAAFSPDGKLIVTASDDHTAGLWDTETGSLVGVLSGDGDVLTGAAFSPDGMSVLTGSRDGTVRLYPCDACGNIDRLMALARHRVTRHLNQEERSLFLHEGAPSTTNRGFGLESTPSGSGTHGRPTVTASPVYATAGPSPIPMPTPIRPATGGTGPIPTPHPKQQPTRTPSVTILHLRTPLRGRFPVTAPFASSAPLEAQDYLYLDKSVGYEAEPHARIGHWHNGISYGVACGTRLYAPAAGVVVSAGFDRNGYGLALKIRHGPVDTLLAYMSAIQVRKGQRVAAGSPVGLSGGGMGDRRDGNSLGCHVHWSVIDRQTGHYLNPLRPIRIK